MIKQTHTPGPWIVRTGKMYGTTHIWVAAPETIIGRTIAGPVPQDILCDEDYPAKLADATLIAAAPDLYAAALEINRLCLIIESSVRHDAGPASTDHKNILAVIKATRAAIVKATNYRDHK